VAPPAAAFGQASYPYQRARTLVLAGSAQDAAGQDELAAVGAAPTHRTGSHLAIYHSSL